MNRLGSRSLAAAALQGKRKTNGVSWQAAWISGFGMGFASDLPSRSTLPNRSRRGRQGQTVPRPIQGGKICRGPTKGHRLETRLPMVPDLQPPFPHARRREEQGRKEELSVPRATEISETNAATSSYRTRQGVPVPLGLYHHHHIRSYQCRKGEKKQPAAYETFVSRGQNRPEPPKTTPVHLSIFVEGVCGRGLSPGWPGAGKRPSKGTPPSIHPIHPSWKVKREKKGEGG
jgi:hypothetical protein